jgi:hypothetical protein
MDTVTKSDAEDREILRSGGWLNDKLVDAINKLVCISVGSDKAQTSLLAQGAGGFKPAQQECMRIVYDHNHWVTVAMVKEEVVVANCLGDNVSPLVGTQLKQLFPQIVREDGSLPVVIVQCAQQPNGSDCGVFAAAFLFEWATSSVKTNLNIKFHITKMRGHLERCLELKEMPLTRGASRWRCPANWGAPA